MSHSAPPTRTRKPTPPWLKAWYAFLVFMAVVTVAAMLINK